jgi:hypothetical protein
MPIASGPIASLPIAGNSAVVTLILLSGRSSFAFKGRAAPAVKIQLTARTRSNSYGRLGPRAPFDFFLSGQAKFMTSGRAAPPQLTIPLTARTLFALRTKAGVVVIRLILPGTVQDIVVFAPDVRQAVFDDGSKTVVFAPDIRVGDF